MLARTLRSRPRPIPRPNPKPNPGQSTVEIVDKNSRATVYSYRDYKLITWIFRVQTVTLSGRVIKLYSVSSFRFTYAA